MNRSKMADECRELMTRLKEVAEVVVAAKDDTPEMHRHMLGLLMELSLDAVMSLSDLVNDDESDARECLKAFLLASTLVTRFEGVWESTREQMAA